MDLSIIIVNYNSAHHVINCIGSILESSMQMKYEIIVVDNASDKKDHEIVVGKYPSVKWIQLDYNAGFARANNAGIKSSIGEYILLLNADTLIKENAIEKVFQKFSTQEKYVACGVQLLNSDGTHQHSGAKFIKGGTNILLPLPYMGVFVKYMANQFQVKQPNVFSVDKDADVDWIVGAFILTKRKHIERAGLLDEDFFMYAEEIEWCSRLRKLGPMVLFAEMDIIHLGGGSSSSYYKVKEYDNSNDLWSTKAKQIIVSQMLRVRKQWGVFWYVFNLFMYFLEIPVFLVAVLFDNLLHGERAKHSFAQFKGYIKNMISAIPYFVDIFLNKHRFYKVW